MRSLPHSWHRTLTQLGFRRKTTRPNRRSTTRLLRIEPLEGRRVLASYTVDTPLDVVDPNDGVLSLREAITAANNSTGVADTISFDTSGAFSTPQTILLDTMLPQLPTITGELTITGPGKVPSTDDDYYVTIDAQEEANHRIFTIDNSTGFEVVTISGLEVTQGNTDFGGAIHALGSLSLNDVAITNSSADSDGGGIYVVASNDADPFETSVHTVTIDNSLVMGNQVNGDGGGVFASAESGIISIRNSLIKNNQAIGGGAQGGGIFARVRDNPFRENLGDFTLQDSIVSGNTSGWRGGGVYVILSESYSYNEMVDGGVTIERSWIDGNSATYSGGGTQFRVVGVNVHEASDASMSIRDTTVSNNRVTEPLMGSLGTENKSSNPVLLRQAA